MDRGKSWYQLILFTYRAFYFPTSPSSRFCTCSNSFQVTLMKSPGLLTIKESCAAGGRVGRPTAQLFDFPDTQIGRHKSAFRPIECNLKPFYRSKRPRDVGMLSMVGGSVKGKLPKMPLFTPRN